MGAVTRNPQSYLCCTCVQYNCVYNYNLTLVCKAYSYNYKNKTSFASTLPFSNQSSERFQDIRIILPVYMHT